MFVLSKIYRDSLDAFFRALHRPSGGGQQGNSGRKMERERGGEQEVDLSAN